MTLQVICTYLFIQELLLYLEKGSEFKDVDGAVLVFMPGLADIQELYELLLADRNFSNENKLVYFERLNMVTEKFCK